MPSCTKRELRLLEISIKISRVECTHVQMLHKRKFISCTEVEGSAQLRSHCSCTIIVECQNILKFTFKLFFHNSRGISVGNKRTISIVHIFSCVFFRIFNRPRTIYLITQFLHFIVVDKTQISDSSTQRESFNTVHFVGDTEISGKSPACRCDAQVFRFLQMSFFVELELSISHHYRCESTTRSSPLFTACFHLHILYFTICVGQCHKSLHLCTHREMVTYRVSISQSNFAVSAMLE